MKLSVIVCVYNTPKQYLCECLRAIRASSLRGIEICLVDDGSREDYSELVSRFDVKYKKTENRGILAARLYGISMAEGDYIAFHDSDDTVSFDFYRPMIAAAEEKNADIVLNDWAFHTDKARYFCKQDLTISADIDKKDGEILKTFFKKCGKQHSLFVLWNKIYRRDILLYAKEKITELGLSERRYMYSEDALINFFAHTAARRMVSVHTGYYFYRVHPSQSVTVISEEKLKSQITDMSETLLIMRRLTENSHELVECIDKWRALMSRAHFSHARAKGYTDLFPYLKERYGTEKLRTSTAADGYIYTVNELLPENFAEIDETLSAIYHISEPIAVDCKKGGYAYKTLLRLIGEGHDITLKGGAGIAIPTPHISLSNKIIHNRFVYTMGTLIFPKGSKIREYIKEKF